MALKKENKKMKNGTRIALLSCIFMGNFIQTLSSLFRDKLTDFERGFCEGLAVSLVIIGAIFLVWCTIKKLNPFKPIQG